MKETEWTRWANQFKASQKCIVPEREGSHKVACRAPATYNTLDGFPSCVWHQNFNARQEWKGFIKGA